MAAVPVVVQGAPSPGIAMLLGFIPGVGAMYNGQFMKAFVHVGIFVMLIVGANHFWLFGLMIPFWVMYMAFDAYKTAQARQLDCLCRIRWASTKCLACRKASPEQAQPLLRLQLRDAAGHS